MPSKREKGIWLDFPAGWAVVKYDGDSHDDNAGFYRACIEHRVQHVRGVDVVSLDRARNRLLLIEVKDFRISSSTADKQANKLRQTIIQKALNTVSGLYSAARAGDEELRPVVERIFRPELIIEVVLLLEQPPLTTAPTTTAAKFRIQNPKTGIQDLQIKLPSVFAALGFDFHLRSSTTMQTQDGWRVRLH
ncbi:hypothetical protein HER32_16745 [Hymenobacter sp. BT18]|uniref:hypothetical protein n=1 Tax=Hymenobacter sp. BT18 TaxID=2835648 RepID=UPI00143EA7EF|nr:hypothetical protein [Hymenobacter sp. BT18]QIX62731.1 hypothetical protein HER32_16745 [Hymenobacter sp. BT18]